jgi:hypothetical protein
MNSASYAFDDAYDDLSSSDDEKNNNSRKASQKRTGARTKECPGCGAKVGVSLKECTYCDHLFTVAKERSVEVQKEEAQNIREKFNFEPEREEDGSLMITAFIGRRPRKQDSGQIRKSHLANDQATAASSKYEHEYLIKYKDMSYRRCQWLSANEIDAMSIKSKQALSRYLNKIDKGDPTAQEDGDIDPTWMEVEKILDFREEEVTEVVDGIDVEDEDDKKSDISIADDDSNMDVDGNRDNDGKVNKHTHKEKLPSTSLASRSSFASQTSLVDAAESSDGSENEDEDGNPRIKSATQVFQHEIRCKKVLERIWDDPYAVSFVDPVDCDVFEDYLDIVEYPMSLSEVKENLENGEYSRYNAHTKFIQDLRLIWQNCKKYNLHKSQIWHSAHTLSMMCERLFQGWVSSYSDGLIELKDPMGQPWEDTCRKCQSTENEDKILLCDHCDAPYHIFCLDPPLDDIPEGSWMCDRCINYFDRSGAKILTATAEDEARHIAENAGVRRLVQRKKKKYLVKWRGLSYRECTWETAADVGDDTVIQEYHALNDAPPDEPPLTRAELDAELRKDRAKPLDMARLAGAEYNPMYDVEAEVYAQIRALHYLKWDQIPPNALLKECGSETYAYTKGKRIDFVVPSKLASTVIAIRDTPDLTVPEDPKKEKDQKYTKPPPVDKRIMQEKDVPQFLSFPSKVTEDKAEISELLGGMLNTVARNGMIKHNYTSRPKLPRSDKCPSEIEVCTPRNWPVGQGKLGIRVANYYGRVVIVGFPKSRTIGLNKVIY